MAEWVDWAQASNGSIDPAKLVDVDGLEHYLNPTAKHYYDLWAEEFEAETGIQLTISEGYRTLTTQQYLWNLYADGNGFVAAKPGTSTHGEALAVDVNSWVYSARQELHDILERIGNKHGWSWTYIGKPSGEAWHFNFMGNPLEITEEDEMSAQDVQDIKDLIVAKSYPFVGYQLWEPGNDDHSINIGAPGVWYHVPNPGYLGILRATGLMSPNDSDLVHIGAKNFFDYAGSIFLLATASN